MKPKNKPDSPIEKDSRYEAAKKRFLISSVLAACIFAVAIPGLFLGEDSEAAETDISKIENGSESMSLGYEGGRLFGMKDKESLWPELDPKRLQEILAKQREELTDKYGIPETLWPDFVEGFCEGYPVGYKQGLEGWEGYEPESKN